MKMNTVKKIVGLAFGMLFFGAVSAQQMVPVSDFMTTPETGDRYSYTNGNSREYGPPYALPDGTIVRDRTRWQNGVFQLREVQSDGASAASIGVVRFARYDVAGRKTSDWAPGWKFMISTAGQIEVGKEYVGEADEKSYAYQQDGSVSEFRSRRKTTFTAMGYETVTTGLGTFTALKLVYSFQSAPFNTLTGGYDAFVSNGAETLWMVKGLNFVKETYVDPSGTLTSFELFTTNRDISQLSAGPTSLTAGWNLVGNSNNATINVNTAFSDANRFSTVWKWTGGKWAFYTPSMTASALSSYAASKGYDVLTTINAGEGFWVNVNNVQGATFALPAGDPLASSSFGSMPSGWNLLSVGGAVTPSSFNRDVGLTPPAVGVVPENLLSLWAWDAKPGQWYFYAPSLEKTGGSALADYASSKGYLDFATKGKTLGSAVGFWVNR